MGWKSDFGHFGVLSDALLGILGSLLVRMAFRILSFCRMSAIAFVLASMSLAGTVTSAEAQYRPPYAEMVVDARTGRVLYAMNPDSLRHPASLTKVMTLYMVFEALESGRITLDTPLKASARAQRQAPSKLGIAAGETISVEDAIKALVTKSANDVAVIVAENLGGTEEEFARLMTRKAQSIGMKRTVFANASGLPNPKQLTTARDLITLGQSIQKRFPKYFDYFSLRSFEYEGASISTHNKLLGRVRGVDGIKTGYTQKSGFNLLTSVHTEERSLLAVVLGGRSGRARDERMADLIDTYLPAASTPAQGAKLVKLPPVKAPKLGNANDADNDKEPSADNEDDAETQTVGIPAPKNLGQPETSSNTQTAALAPTPMPEPQALPKAAAPAPLAAPEITQSEAPQPKPQAPASAKAKPLSAPEPTESAPANALAYTAPAANPPVEPKEIAVAPNGLKLAWQTGAQPIDPRTTGSKRPAAANSVFIQIGTAQTESDAKRLLSSARDKGGAQLSAANMQTEKVTVNGKTIWRARFSMNDESLAHDVCKTLKKSKMACFVSRG